MLEYPVWLVCGFLVPLTLFPDWVRPISWVLAPTWGINAIRECRARRLPLAGHRDVRSPSAPATSAIGVLLLDRVLSHAARSKATLALT